LLAETLAYRLIVAMGSNTDKPETSNEHGPAIQTCRELGSGHQVRLFVHVQRSVCLSWPGSAAMLQFYPQDSPEFVVITKVLTTAAAFLAGMSAFSRVWQQKNVTAVSCIKKKTD
jgi:hypothetical protein